MRFILRHTLPHSILQFIPTLLLTSFLGFPCSAFAWNSMGHRIIGEIAYQHLTPNAKAHSVELIEYLANAYPYSSTFQTANSWADFLKLDGVHAYDNWHFDNKPYSLDGTPTQPEQTPNLVWALNQSISVMENPKSNQYEKAFFMRFLMHLTGDAHQPLHCINFYSQQYPNGDNGGNAEPNHLHAQWDNGWGLFDAHCGFSSNKSKRADCLADKIEHDYPESYFGSKVSDTNPQDWVNESFDIAKTQQHSRAIVEQQVALAGYRLANVLNNLLG